MTETYCLIKIKRRELLLLLSEHRRFPDMILKYILWFIVVYFAKRLAITPLLQTKDTPKEVEEQHKKLIQLRDLDILDNDELEKYIKVYYKCKGKSREENTI